MFDVGCKIRSERPSESLQPLNQPAFIREEWIRDCRCGNYRSWAADPRFIRINGNRNELLRVTAEDMNKKKLRSIAAELGTRGGHERAKHLTPEQRREIARLGGQAYKNKMEQRKRGEAK